MKVRDIVELPSVGPDFDLSTAMNAPTEQELSFEERLAYVPLCATCAHACKRGNFYFCRTKGPGYRMLGTKVDCTLYKEPETDE